MTVMKFDVDGHPSRSVTVKRVINAGFAGKDSAAVRAHVEELATLGVPRPESVPTAYVLAPTTPQQTREVWVLNDHTSGEAEWALIVDDDEKILVTAASDHSDRSLEAERIEWGKQIAPNVIAESAWPLKELADPDALRLRSWAIANDDTRTLLQDGTLDQLLPFTYWTDRLSSAGLLKPGTVLLGGTLPMLEPESQYAGRWAVELYDPARDRAIIVDYFVNLLPTLQPERLSPSV